MNLKNLCMSYELGNLLEAIDAKPLYGPLSSSKVFEFANKSSKVNGLALTDVLPRMATDGEGFTHVPYKLLSKELVFALFESRTFKMRNKKSVQEAVEKGEVILAYSEKFKVPVSIPFIIQKTGNGYRVIVNICSYGEFDSSGSFVAKERNNTTLMSLIYTGYIVQRIVSTNYTPPLDVLKTLTITYGNMFGSIIGGLCSLDPLTTQKMKYIGARFAATQMYGTDFSDDFGYKYLIKEYSTKYGEYAIGSVDKFIPADSYDNLNMLIAVLTEKYPSIKPSMLNMTSFIEAWIKRYDVSVVFAIDYTGYLLYHIISVLLGSSGVNIRSMESVIPINYANSMYKTFENF
jgi:hypothetical protein